MFPKERSPQTVSESFNESYLTRSLVIPAIPPPCQYVNRKSAGPMEKSACELDLLPSLNLAAPRKLDLTHGLIDSSVVESEGIAFTMLSGKASINNKGNVRIIDRPTFTLGHLIDRARDINKSSC